MGNMPYAVKIGGLAGQGIKAAGLMLSKIATRSGYFIHTYTEFPSVIRGGHNVVQICIDKSEVLAPTKTTNLLIALNQETVDKHAGGLVPGGGVIFDKDKRIDTAKVDAGANLFALPLSKLAVAAGNQELLVNTVALGAVTAVLGGKPEILKDLVTREFADKGDEIVRANLKAAESGYDFAKQEFGDKVTKILEPAEKVQQKMVVNGAEAVALGAIAGGMQFASIYPMSPISNILQVLALYQEKYGYIYRQPEDEIAAVNMAIGAAFAGARAMTVTSGGGFCLMTEGLGLAAMTETPLVIVEGMRPGPATGLPTWTAQGDLQFVLRAHQGDFPRIVLAAGDGTEAFYLTMQALNLADKYQTPVIVLIDKNICDDDQSYPVFDISDYQSDRGKITTGFNPNYTRYAPETDGVSFRTIPGSGNFFIANSDEHTNEGFSTDEEVNVSRQQVKRMAKLTTCEKEDMPRPQLIGPPKAEVTIVSWGSNKGSILTAMREFPGGVNFLHLTWMSPFPTAAVKEILGKAKHVVDVECNQTGQLAGLIAEKTGIQIADRFLKSNGRPIFPEEIADKLKETLKPYDPIN